MDYKISIHGKNFYKEIKLTEDWAKGLCIGTTKECQMRFSRDSFTTEFVIHVRSQNGQWSAESDEAVVLRKQDNTEEKLQYLMPLDTITVCSRETKEEMFCLEFSIDFVSKTEDFDREIICREYQKFAIGGAQGCSIRVKDPVLANDYLNIYKEGNNWIVDAKHARYGVLINGYQKRTRQFILCENDMITINGFSFYWNEETLHTSKETEIETELPMKIESRQKNHLQYPKFVRSARQQFVIPKEKIDILSPKTKPEEPKKNLVMTMVPMLVSMGMMVMMRMTMSGNIMFVIMCVAMGGVSAVMAVINYRNEGLQYKKNIVKRENDYNKYIAVQEAKIQELREKERIISKQKYPSIEEEITYVEDFDARLFEKQKTHEDYLFIRLGDGTVPSQCEIGYKEQEYREVDDPLMDYPVKIHEKYEYIEDMPVMLDLTNANAVGFLGDRTHLYQVAKNLILQFCIEHYYQDVKLFLIMGKEDKKYFQWARWFRNFHQENGMRNFVYDEDSSKGMLEYIYAQLSEREKLKEQEIKTMQTNVVLVYRSDLLGEHPISNFFEKAAKLGFVFIFFEEYPEKLNQHCSKRIFLDENDFTGYIQDIMDGEQIQHFRYKHISVEQAASTALKMGCVYVDEVSLEASLTKNITLYQLLGIMNVYDLDLRQRWNSSKIYDSMAAPLGVKSGDEIVYLDLHEKYHGPHGLVAGTTGSGKSEILQTYILSMATLFHPYEIGFIIIDFKGGGMVNQFRNLPHLNGAITNIDGKAINRSLSSIKSELRKRQRLFAEYDVNHINDYIRLFKEGKAKQPLPHLILIVDEFAELKSEQPDFMKELISAARIGRSLGVHLILATQKPSGVVNDQIWSNSKFKLCLKVQNQSDSNEVLKSPLAAEIREPGRAYLQVGNNEIFQLFQSAYSGAPVPNGAMGETKKFKISKVDLCGRREVIYEQKPTEQKGGDTQLDAIVDFVEEYCRLNKIERLPDICLPPLAEEIPYTMDGFTNDTTDICVPIGIYDDPENQYQGVMDVNFSQGHIFIIGSSQTGKTNMLQNMIRGLVTQYSSNDVQIYLLDFASMILKNFEELKHVGDVITTTEEEKLKNFFKMMEEEIAKRKAILAEMGLSSYSAYRESGQRELSQIVVMVDNIGVFREIFSSLDEKMLKLVREGSSVGISMVITSQQTSGLGYRYLSNFVKRFALYCNDSGEYSTVFERCKTGLNAVPGRCLLSMDKSIYEGQVYIAFPAEKEIDRVNEIRSFIKEINDKDQGKGADKTPVVPAYVTRQMLYERLETEREPYGIALGMNFDNLDVDTISMNAFSLLGICGSNELGRVDYVKYMIDELYDRKQSEPVAIHIYDSEEKELECMKGNAEEYTTNLEEMVTGIRNLYEKIKGRKGKELSKETLEVMILNSKQLYDLIGEDEELLKMCCDMLTEYVECKFSFLLSDVPNVNLNFKATSFVKLLRNAQNLIIFEDMKNIKVFEPGVQIRTKYSKPLQEQEMYFKCGNYLGKYKVPRLEQV